jgi:transmembrane sensor
VAAVSREQVSQLLAWQPKLLDFTAAPLRSVVAEFNRCNAPVHLVIADTELAELEVSASLRSDNVEGFIRLLEAGFGVRVERDTGTITLRRR